MGSTVKKFLAMLLVACFCFTAGIGCSGDSKKDSGKGKSSQAPKQEKKLS